MGGVRLRPARGLLRPTWTPVLDGCARQHALELVAGIAGDLEARYRADPEDAGGWTLDGGRCGVALFFAYLGQALGDTAAASLTAVRLLSEALAMAAAPPRTASLYQTTGRSAFRGAAKRWVERVFDEHARGSVPPDGSNNAASELLQGVVGIGLVLLALATPLEPRWDRVLLLS